jgi:WD40 repeat protein
MLSLSHKIVAQFDRKSRQRTITSSDRDEYPSIRNIEAGSRADGRLLRGPSQLNPRSVDWPHLQFKHKNAENGPISSIALSPDGKLLAAAWDDVSTTIWRMADGLTVQHLEDKEQGHSDTVWTITFSPNGKYIVSGSADATAVIWEVWTGNVVKRLEGHALDVTSVACSPDGSLIVTGSTDCSVKVWNSLTYELMHTLEGHTADVRQVLISSDGSRLASCADDEAALWDPRAGVEIAKLQGHTGPIWCMAFSPEGDRLVTGSDDQSGRIWDAYTGEELVTINEHTDSLSSIAFSPDGKGVASASNDCTVVTCDAWTGEQHYTFTDAEMSSTAETIAYSPKGDLLAAGFADGNIWMWNSSSGEFVAEYQGHEEKVKSVMFTPDGSDLVSWADDGTVRCWSVIDTLRLA